MAKKKEVGFEHGVLWAIARIVEFYGEETQAAEILAESGIDISIADEHDLPFLEVAKADPMYARRVGGRGQSNK
jgi:hypothetical protein